MTDFMVTLVSMSKQDLIDLVLLMRNCNNCEQCVSGKWLCDETSKHRLVCENQSEWKWGGPHG